jgi:hypothetical protein
MRAAVAERAKHRCEYCRLPNRGQAGRFPIDHILPRTEGGTTTLDNLSFACPHCNGHKWMHTMGHDPETDTVQPLFHPRLDTWDSHFAWSETRLLQGLSPSGRSTISRLQINHPDMVEVRRLMSDLGLFPELSDATPPLQPDGA